MRLLHTSSHELHTFFGAQIPPYAILSHTWGADEVTFDDMRHNRSAATQKAGYEKVRRCCKEAAAYGLDYVWIDTCCIDKSSSAELSEAINAMFRWYQTAQACYAYLADTLQELIAPPTVQFFAQDWVEIGTKATLQKQVVNITGIDAAILCDCARLGSASIAQRMSWAARRETTRTEDVAYCLMGLFGINMPMLYGEGEKAFERLQLEIVKVSHNHSIFAWAGPGSARGALARSPAEFAGSGGIVPFFGSAYSSPYSMTNMGLSVTLPFDHDVQLGVHVARFDCGYVDSTSHRRAHISTYLRRLGDGSFVRIRCSQLYACTGLAFTQKHLYIAQHTFVEEPGTESNSTLAVPHAGTESMPPTVLNRSDRSLLWAKTFPAAIRPILPNPEQDSKQFSKAVVASGLLVASCSVPFALPDSWPTRQGLSTSEDRHASGVGPKI